ncbi:hypothetical protein ACFRAR_11005 [Kitasatospora sp. NPDC056651]|uniref:hypothetical protein n=1 Tax=Kitasatospora sp. NPDC056651 TaxID=3345892 RepID=UPI003682484E
MTRLKLRPGCHFAPVPQGLHCSFRDTAFVVRGPAAALFDALDRRLGPLTDGAAPADLADGPSGPLLAKLLPVLTERGLLFDPDAAGGPPPTDPRHEEIVAHLEEHAEQPYALYHRLRRTTAAVTGTGPAADAATRSLARLAVGTAAPPDGSAEVTVRVLADHSSPADDSSPGAVLPVSCGPRHAVVGPVLDDPARIADFRAAVRRVAGWLAVLPQGPAPMPVGAVLAGALAARRVVDRITGLAPVDGALVVHGPTAEVTAVALPDRTAATGWQPLDPDEPPGDTDPAVLTEPWRGLGHWPDAAGPEHRRPVAAVTLHPVLPAGAAPLTGWGEDATAARRHALLALLRRHADGARAEPDAARAEPDGAGAADPVEQPCAGTTPAHATLDGLLRALTPRTQESPGRALPPSALEHPTARALHSALADYHGHRFDLTVHRLGDGSWHLAAARTPDGDPLAVEWGPSPASAAYAVLGTLFTARTTGGTHPVTGTWCVEHLTPPALTRSLHALLAEHRVTLRRLPADPVLGPLPWTCARLRLH